MTGLAAGVVVLATACVAPDRGGSEHLRTAWGKGEEAASTANWSFSKWALELYTFSYYEGDVQRLKFNAPPMTYGPIDRWEISLPDGAATVTVAPEGGFRSIEGSEDAQADLLGRIKGLSDNVLATPLDELHDKLCVVGLSLGDRQTNEEFSCGQSFFQRVACTIERSDACADDFRRCATREAFVRGCHQESFEPWSLTKERGYVEFRRDGEIRLMFRAELISALRPFEAWTFLSREEDAEGVSPNRTVVGEQTVNWFGSASELERGLSDLGTLLAKLRFGEEDREEVEDQFCAAGYTLMNVECARAFLLGVTAAIAGERSMYRLCENATGFKIGCDMESSPDEE